jgi:hypothetical protein
VGDEATRYEIRTVVDCPLPRALEGAEGMRRDRKRHERKSRRPNSLAGKFLGAVGDMLTSRRSKGKASRQASLRQRTSHFEPLEQRQLLAVTAVDDSFSTNEDTIIRQGYDEMIAPGATWSYLDDGSDQGTAWQATSFDDSSWATGAAELGYGDGDEATTVSYGGNANDKHETTYFRHEFNVTDADEVDGLNLRIKRDDGVAVYLNGTEIKRDNLASGANYDDLATATVDDEAADEFLEFMIDASLVEGTNVLAVEIHQASVTSSDISMDVQLFGLRPDDGPLDNDTGSPLTADIDPNNPFLFGELLTWNDNGTFEYLPDPNFFGVDTLKYTVTDGVDTSDPATITLTVNAVDDTPETSDQTYKIAKNGQLTVNFNSLHDAIGDAALLIAPGNARVPLPPDDPNYANPVLGTAPSWQFLDNGADPGVDWMDSSFDDSKWKTGQGEFGYGDEDDAPVRTEVDYGPDDDNRFVTTYFRHTFNVASPSSIDELYVYLLRDDGAAVYLNGTEVTR